MLFHELFLKKIEETGMDKDRAAAEVFLMLHMWTPEDEEIAAREQIEAEEEAERERHSK